MHIDHVDESLFLMFIFDFVLFIMSLELNLYSTIKVYSRSSVWLMTGHSSSNFHKNLSILKWLVFVIPNYLLYN